MAEPIRLKAKSKYLLFQTNNAHRKIRGSIVFQFYKDEMMKSNALKKKMLFRRGTLNVHFLVIILHKSKI